VSGPFVFLGLVACAVIARLVARDGWFESALTWFFGLGMLWFAGLWGHAQFSRDVGLERMTEVAHSVGQSANACWAATDTADATIQRFRGLLPDTATVWEISDPRG